MKSIMLRRFFDAGSVKVGVLDNYASHKVEGAIKAIYEKGATVLYLPPYSPDYNPIEYGWSKMKSELRRIKAKTYDELVAGMKTALDKISVSDV